VIRSINLAIGARRYLAGTLFHSVTPLSDSVASLSVQPRVHFLGSRTLSWHLEKKVYRLDISMSSRPISKRTPDLDSAQLGASSELSGRVDIWPVHFSDSSTPARTTSRTLF